MIECVTFTANLFYISSVSVVSFKWSSSSTSRCRGSHSDDYNENVMFGRSVHCSVVRTIWLANTAGIKTIDLLSSSSRVGEGVSSSRWLAGW